MEHTNLHARVEALLRLLEGTEEEEGEDDR